MFFVCVQPAFIFDVCSDEPLTLIKRVYEVAIRKLPFLSIARACGKVARAGLITPRMSKSHDLRFEAIAIAGSDRRIEEISRKNIYTYIYICVNFKHTCAWSFVYAKLYRSLCGIEIKEGNLKKKKEKEIRHTRGVGIAERTKCERKKDEPRRRPSGSRVSAIPSPWPSVTKLN